MDFKKRETLICHANAYMHTFLIQLSVPQQLFSFTLKVLITTEDCR